MTTDMEVSREWSRSLKAYTQVFEAQHQREFLEGTLNIHKLYRLRTSARWIQWEEGELIAFLDKLLAGGDLPPAIRKELLSPQVLPYFITAFTHPSVDEVNNYEAFEFLG